MMSDSNESSATTAPAAPAAAENQTPAGHGSGVASITRRWKKDDMFKKGSMIARGFGFLFSLISFIIMASNKHGDWKNFDNYEEYRYLLAIAILSTLYTGVQSLRHVDSVWKGKQILDQRTASVVDFVCDQAVSYLLISSVSAAIPLTNRMREGQDNIFTDTSASAISISFFAFVSLSISAVISGYKLSTQSYI